jgi:hypothetical protein
LSVRLSLLYVSVCLSSACPSVRIYRRISHRTLFREIWQLSRR